MLITVRIRRLPSGDFHATAPDLARCAVSDPDQGNALARLRLAIEDELARRLLAGQPLPSDARAAPPSVPAAEHCYEVHINMGHIEALARHQRGRG